MTTNLKEALSRLVCRDERLKIFGDEFWVINKQLKNIVADMPLGEIQNVVNKELMNNVPWVYAFEIRAKLFRCLCEKVMQDSGYGYEAEQISVRREYLLEDALDKIISGQIDPRKQW